MGSRFFKPPPYQIKKKPVRFKKQTSNTEAYEQMHQTLGLAVLTVLMDANIRKQDEHMEWNMRPKQLINILKKHSDEFVANTLKEYAAEDADWMNETAQHIEEVMRAVLTVAMSVNNSEIAESRLRTLIKEIKLLADSVQTDMWKFEDPQPTSLAA